MRPKSFLSIFLKSLLIGVIITVSLTIHCQAQEKKESYKSLKSRSSRSNVEQLIQDANQTKSSNPSQTLNTVQEALALSIASGDTYNEAKCYLLLGEINEGIREWTLALDYYDKAYQRLQKKFDSTPEYLRTLNGLSNTNLNLGNYQQALNHLSAILKLSLTETQLAECKLNISEVYYLMNQFNEALKTLNEIKTSLNPQNEILEAKIQNLKAKVYAKLNEVDKANDFYQSAQRNLRSAGPNVPQQVEQEPASQSAKEEISEAYREQKRYDEDIDLRNQSIDYNLEKNNLDDVAKDKIELSKSLVAKGETSKAILELEEAATIADTIDNPRDQASAYLNLAQLYERNGNTERALNTYKKYSDAILRNEAQNEEALLYRAELIKKQKDIEAFSGQLAIEQQEERSILQQQQIVIYGLIIIIGIISITSYFIFKNAQESKRANQLLALKSLRSQMNPHFIFNALNSVNQFISLNDERSANKYLSEFSRLMRLVLDNSQEDFITLEKEEEMISLYVKLEHYRFRDKFDYHLSIDEQINKESVFLPPMLIQPYLENAVWHGLRYKETRGKLDISITKTDSAVNVVINDDGIGRKKSASLKTHNQKKHNSTGLKNVNERLTILNRLYKTNYQVNIEDLPNEAGTRVSISLPIQSNIHAS